MKLVSFWLLTVGVLAVAVVPACAALLALGTFDWFGIGLSISALCVAILLIWALFSLRHDAAFAPQERSAVRGAVFFDRLGWLIWLDPIHPWLYLRDRVYGRNTRSWLRGGAA
jgi:hypothetical protein